MVSTNPIDFSVPNDTRTAAPRTNPSSSGFAATMAAEVGGTSTLERAEELIGTRIRAPEGGCGCDALVSTVMPSPPPAADRSLERSPAVTMPTAMPTARPTATPAAALSQAWDVSPGRILVLNDPNDLGDHLHQAILRNATEMIAANRNGLVEVLSIPWDQVQPR